jgi:hypothetical protein
LNVLRATPLYAVGAAVAFRLDPATGRGYLRREIGMMTEIAAVRCLIVGNAKLTSPLSVPAGF